MHCDAIGGSKIFPISVDDQGIIPPGISALESRCAAPEKGKDGRRGGSLGFSWVCVYLQYLFACVTLEGWTMWRTHMISAFTRW